METRFKISFSLGLKGVPLYREIPATQNHLIKLGPALVLGVLRGAQRAVFAGDLRCDKIEYSYTDQWVPLRPSKSCILKRFSTPYTKPFRRHWSLSG